MKPADREPFLEIVVGFAEIRGKTLSAPALELYWNAMQSWSLNDFQEAANQLIRTCEWMPTPKHFEDLRKAGRHTPGEAWLTARQHIRWGLHGYTLDPRCPALVAKAVHVIGGPNVIGMCDEDKLTFLERRFTEHFETMQESEDTRELVPQIVYGHKSLDLKTVAGTFKAVGK